MDDPLAALPSILAGLEDGGASQEAAALELAQLVDAAAGEDALRLGAALRRSGAVELLAELLAAGSALTRRWVLMAIANLSSDAFDANSAATKQMLRGCAIIERLLPLLGGADEASAIYACAALQNVSKDRKLAQRALKARVYLVLDRLVCSADASEQMKSFAAGALLNLSDAAAAAAGPKLTPRARLARLRQSQPLPDAELPLSPAARAAMELRRQQEADEAEVDEHADAQAAAEQAAEAAAARARARGGGAAAPPDAPAWEAAPRHVPLLPLPATATPPSMSPSSSQQSFCTALSTCTCSSSGRGGGGGGATGSATPPRSACMSAVGGVVAPPAFAASLAASIPAALGGSPARRKRSDDECSDASSNV
jgi:hypothetical protein